MAITHKKKVLNKTFEKLSSRKHAQPLGESKLKNSGDRKQ